MRVALLAGLAALVLAPTASAQAPIVQAIDGTEADNFNFRWTPRDVTIRAGETVTWRFTGTDAPHNVAVRGTTFRSGEPTRVPADAAYRFDTPGFYDFVCEVHLPSMAGTVTVTDASGAPPPPPPPPPLSEQHWANDQSPPSVLEVTDEKRPRLSRVRVAGVRDGARVRFRLSERARVTVRFKLAGLTVNSVRRTFKAGRHRLTVRDPRMHGRYRVEVFARDAAGNRSATRRATVRVRR